MELRQVSKVTELFWFVGLAIVAFTLYMAYISVGYGLWISYYSLAGWNTDGYLVTTASVFAPVIFSIWVLLLFITSLLPGRVFSRRIVITLIFLSPAIISRLWQMF